MFVDLMFNIENTLIIGGHTAGVLTSIPSESFVLPNSKIPVVANDLFFLHSPEHFAEGIGFAPDIWVHGCARAAALVLAGQWAEYLENRNN
jgi:hypothetical protein